MVLPCLLVVAGRSTDVVATLAQVALQMALVLEPEQGHGQVPMPTTPELVLTVDGIVSQHVMMHSHHLLCVHLTEELD